MSHDRQPKTAAQQRRERVVAIALATLAGVLVVLALAGAGAAPAAASNHTTNNSSLPYYNNSSGSVNASPWFAGNENVSLDSLVGMATRLGPFVIGTGSTIPGGTGYSGPVILGLLVAGVALGAVAGTRVGGPGGAVVALVTTYGLISVGLAPAWIRIVVLVIVGGVAAVAAIRAAR